VKENNFAQFAADYAKKNFNKKALPRLLGEAGSYWWNRLPDHADRLTRPGIRNKVNALVGNAASEVVNFGTDAALQMALAGLSAATAPETGGVSIAAHPLTAFLANQVKDSLTQTFVDPMLYDIADNDLDLGHRIPDIPGYKNSLIQKAVNKADTAVTKGAKWVGETHPKTMTLNKAGSIARAIGNKQGASGVFK
jgi:hypothetical protein